MQEFLNIFVSTIKKSEAYTDGDFYIVPDHFSHFGLSDNFDQEHAAVQYILMCKALAK